MQGFRGKGSKDARNGDKGCRDSGIKEARMQGNEDKGCKDAGTEGCRDARMQVHRDAGMQGSRMQGCKYRGRPEHDCPRKKVPKSR